VCSSDLVGVKEPAQQSRIEPAVGVCDEDPCQAINPRVALQRSTRQLRQLAIEAGRQIVFNLADLLRDHGIVIDEPLGCRGDWLILARGLGDGTVRLEQHPAVVSQPRRERPAPLGSGRHRLCCGEAFGMLLQALDAEELRADRLFQPPGSKRRSPAVTQGKADASDHEHVCATAWVSAMMT